MEKFSGRIEVGQPAIIIASVQAPQLVGCTVEVLAYLGTGDSVEFERGRTMHNPQGNRMWYVRLEGATYVTVNGLRTKTGAIREQHLMPIPPLDDEQLSKETENNMEAV